MEGGDRSRVAFRTAVLEENGATDDLIAELLAYTESPWRTGASPLPDFPLADEPHIEAWLEYERDARARGAWEALKERLVQLRFPIQAGMSENPDYRMATRRGVLASEPLSPGLVLNRPDALELSVHRTMAGHVPVLVAGDRGDFVALVRALSSRNEPVPVPDSMGACIVTGFNNWDRVARYRRAWEVAQSEPPGEDAWASEFERLVPRKSLYQDRFILLSRGPYSAVSAESVGIDTPSWLATSLEIRREHEFTHYFTYRVFGSMRNYVLDELLGDFAGLTRALGTYRADWALRFLGLEGFPRYRRGGRLESYRGEPPLSDASFEIVQALAYRSAANLEAFSKKNEGRLDDLGNLARAIASLAGFTLEELASNEMEARAEAGDETEARE